MTKIATDFASKFAVAFVAVAMIFAAYAPAAQAQSSEDLQQMINDLLAQVAQLQAGAGATTQTPGTCAPNFLMDFGIGSTGAGVMAIQKFLNQDPDTRVAVSGVGSMGMETEYYGALTAAAVSKFQVKYRAEILSPLGLVNPTGYWGSGSRDKANSTCANSIEEPVDGEEEEEGEETEEGEEEEEEFELGGEADLTDFMVDDAEDNTIEEGDEEVEIGMFTVRFENGDAELSRMDIALVAGTGNDTADEEDAYDVFETIQLWVDGDMIAEVDASDEDEYLDEDRGTIRFSNLDLVAMEDEDLEIIVGATINGNVDGSVNGNNWDLFAQSVRFFDADGVASTEDSVDDLQDDNSGTAASFTIEEEGFGDDLAVRTSSEDPEATTLPLEDDTNTEFVSFAFELDADDSDADIEVNSFVLGVNTLSSTSAAINTTTIIDDIKVFVGGDEVSTDDVTISATTSGLTTATEKNGQILVEFDNEFYIDAEDTATVEIEVEYKSLSMANEGTTVRFSLDGADVDAEGADDIDVTGAATGDVHTLRTEGVILAMSSEDFSLKANSTTDASDDEGVYTLKFDVTAFEEDFYFNKTAARGTSTDDTAGVEYTIESGSATVATGTATESLTSDASTEGSRYVVREGETKSFTLKVNFDPLAGGFYAVQLENVNYFMSSTATVAEMQAAIPAEDYETDEYSI